MIYNKFDEEIDLNLLHRADIQDIIHEVYDSIPLDKRTKDFKNHIKIYNELVNFYNKKVGDKIYKNIK